MAGSHPLPLWRCMHNTVFRPVLMPCCAALQSDQKLIGNGNAGLYFSVLQSNGAISRALAGQVRSRARSRGWLGLQHSAPSSAFVRTHSEQRVITTLV